MGALLCIESTWRLQLKMTISPPKANDYNRCTMRTKRSSIDIKIEVKLPDGAKDPVFWFIAQSKKASLEKKPLPSSIRKVGEATQKEEAIGKVSNLVSEVSLVLALCKSVINQEIIILPFRWRMRQVFILLHTHIKWST